MLKEEQNIRHLQLRLGRGSEIDGMSALLEKTDQHNDEYVVRNKIIQVEFS